MHGVVAVHREDSAKRVSVNGVNQCHLLKRKIIEIYPPSTIGLVYLRIYLKTDASCLTKNSSL